MRLGVICLVVVVLAFATGCAKPEYLVPGLGLPPDAKVIEKIQINRLAASILGAATGERPIEECVVSVFNCPGGWREVDSYTRNCMAPRGYTELMTEVDRMTGGALSNRGSGGTFKGIHLQGVSDEPESFFNYMRLYAKRKNRVPVIVINVKAMRQAYGNTGLLQQIPQGDFALAAYRMREPLPEFESLPIW